MVNRFRMIDGIISDWYLDLISIDTTSGHIKLWKNKYPEIKKNSGKTIQAT